MGSGDTIWVLEPLNAVPVGSNYATRDYITDSSTPNALIPVLDFDGGTDEHAHWFVTVPSHYDGGGFTWEFQGGVDGSDTDAIEMELRIKKVSDTTDFSSDLGIDTQTSSDIADTPPATPADKLNYSTTGTLSHANADSPSEDDYMIIRITRDVSHATNTDDFQLAKVIIKET